MERDLKEEAKTLIDNLPFLSSWEQLMCEIYVREAIENGMADSIEGRKASVDDVRAEFDFARMKVNWTCCRYGPSYATSTFIARSSPHYARKIVDRLTRRSQQIATFPRSGRVVREANELNIREVLEGSYRIIYHLLDDEVEIIAVVRSARPWPEKP